MDSNNWELAKENIQPLKQGRNMEILSTTLKEDKMSGVEIEKREAKRREFEGDLRIYSGDDPLGLWYKYILWIEQNYPEGGQEANIIAVLESCITEFHAETKYKQDNRLLDIFLKYVSQINDPLEIFNFMNEENVGTQLAQFYINWSWYLENVCNIQKAEEVLSLGIQTIAQPNKELEDAKHHLQLRVAKSISKEGLHDEEDEEVKRQPLAGLKGQKKKSGKVLAPITRTGDVIDINAGGLKTKSVSSSKNSAPKIYVDENDEGPKKDNVAVAVPIQSTADHENILRPGKWTENRLKKTKSHAAVKLDFQIHEDADSEDVPIHLPPEANALRVRRRRSKSPPCAREKLPGSMNFYCDLRKLYSGGTEYQFEEIRGRKMMVAMEREAEKKKAEEFKLQNQKMQEELSLQVEKSKKLESEVEWLKEVVQKLMKETEAKNNPKDTEADILKRADASHPAIEASRIVRDLWNGTLEKSSCLESSKTQLYTRPAISEVKSNFVIFQDPSNVTESQFPKPEMTDRVTIKLDDCKENEAADALKEKPAVVHVHPLEELSKPDETQQPKLVADTAVGRKEQPVDLLTADDAIPSEAIKETQVVAAAPDKDFIVFTDTSSSNSKAGDTNAETIGAGNLANESVKCQPLKSINTEESGRTLGEAKEVLDNILAESVFKTPVAPESTNKRPDIDCSAVDVQDTDFINLSLPISAFRSRMSLDAYTLPVPESECEFLAAISSTPKQAVKAAPSVQEKKQPEVPTNAAQPGKLSPINETSREYKSSSSSSSSGAYSGLSGLTRRHKLFIAPSTKKNL